MPPLKVHLIKAANTDGQSVAYVLSNTHNIKQRKGLMFAQQLAAGRKQPLAVVYTLSAESFESLEHFGAVIKGLTVTERALAKRNMPLVLLFGKHEEVLSYFFTHTRPSAIIFEDYGAERAVRRFDVAADMFTVESSFEDAEGVANHAFSWPGIVIPLKGLQKQIRDVAGMLAGKK